MLYFARHLEVVAGVAPEAAPLESFGVEEHHCVARLATVSARTGPECRAHPCLLLSATAVRCLPAYGPRQRTGAGPAHVGCPGYAAPCDSCPLTARLRAKLADRRRARPPEARVPTPPGLLLVVLDTPRRATTVRPPVGATAPSCRPGSKSSLPASYPPCSGR